MRVSFPWLVWSCQLKLYRKKPHLISLIVGQKEFSQQGVAMKERKIWVTSLRWMSDRINIPVLIPPTGGMFEYVSGANFLGEITEWVGFALAGHSVHSAAFAVFTAVVLASRAVAHHK